jgi:hypothetical protein
MPPDPRPHFAKATELLRLSRDTLESMRRGKMKWNDGVRDIYHLITEAGTETDKGLALQQVNIGELRKQIF